MQIETSTKLGVQASVAVALAVAVGYLFHWEHSYWAILTAMLLISQTWGESIKKSFERVAMTILGGCVGTALYFLVAQHNMLVVIILMVSIFFNVYFAGRSYLYSIFFATILVVFLFANLRDWTVQILEERILETMMGAIIAIVTTALIFPIRGIGKLPQLLSNFIGALVTELHNTFALVLEHRQDQLQKQKRINLYKQFVSLRQRIKLISYELFFSLYPRAKIKKIILQLGTLVHYTTNVMEVADEIDKHLEIERIHDDLIAIREVVLANLSLLKELFINGKTQDQVVPLNEILEEVQFKTAEYIKTTKVNKSHWFVYLSFFYYLKKLNDITEELIYTVGHVKKGNNSPS